MALTRERDMRNALAKARDEWFDSDEGKSCVDPRTLRAPASQWSYLHNRLERAFIAGWNARDNPPATNPEESQT